MDKKTKERIPGPGLEECLDQMFLVSDSSTSLPDDAKERSRCMAWAKRTWSRMKRSRVTLCVFLAIFFALVWRLGSYPAYFNDIVEHMIHVQADKIFDHIDASKIVTWTWTAMYTHQAYTSPVYSFFIDAGLRLFGLTLLGVRIFPALFEFLALLLAYFGLKKFLPRNLILIFLALLALSPWHLLYARSGGIFGVSTGMYLIAVSMLLLMHGRTRSLAFAIAAGLSVALLPYGYVALRLIFLVLIVIAFYASFRIDRTNSIVFFSTVALVVSIQLSGYPDSFKQFFNARGEALNNIAKSSDGSYNIPLLIEMLKRNVGCLYNQLLGFNDSKHYLNVNIANSFYTGDVVLYPKFLVPFLLLGIAFCLYHLIFKRKALPGLLLLLFGIGLVPGLMAGIGLPNLSRSMLLLAPVYLLIAYGIYHSFALLQSVLSPWKPRLVPILLILAVLATSMYQLYNYFDYTKDEGAKNVVQHRIFTDVIQTFVREYPGKTILYHDASPFYVYSYVLMEWVGQDEIRTLLDDGRLTFVRQDSADWVHKRVQAGQFDLIISMDPKTLERIYPEVTNMFCDKEDGYSIYTTDPSIEKDLFLPAPTSTPVPSTTLVPAG